MVRLSHPKCYDKSERLRKSDSGRLVAYRKYLIIA